MLLTDLASIATIGAFLIAIGSLAFSARKYIRITEKTQESERFEIFHKLIKTISRGADESGTLKLVSQIAFIYELRNFPEYQDLTETLLNQLRIQWAEAEPKQNFPLLKLAIDETLASLQQNK